jgi:hypothetical protein
MERPAAQVGDDLADALDADRVADVLQRHPALLEQDRGVHPDHTALGVEERTARVAR